MWVERRICVNECLRASRTCLALSGIITIGIFNVLGGVYERNLGKKVGEAFEAEIADPIQMQDSRIGDMYYVTSTHNLKHSQNRCIRPITFASQ